MIKVIGMAKWEYFRIYPQMIKPAFITLYYDRSRKSGDNCIEYSLNEGSDPLTFINIPHNYIEYYTNSYFQAYNLR